MAACIAIMAGMPLVTQAQTWDGGGTDNNWTTPNNWNPNAVPANNGTANILFLGSVRLTPTINVIQSVNAIGFGSGSGSFTVTNGAFHTHLEVGAGGIINIDNSLQTIDCEIRLLAAQTWKAQGGPVSLGVSQVNGINSPLTIDGGFNTSLGKMVGNFGTFTKNGAGTLFLTDNGTFTGSVAINAGTLSLGNDTQLGDTGNNVTINGGALQVTAANLITARNYTLTAAGATLNGGANQLSFNGGTLTVNGGSVTCADGLIGYDPNTIAAAIIDSANSSWTVSDSFAAGLQGTGTLTIQNGGGFSGSISHIGSVAGSTGTATVTGTGSHWNNSGFLGVGYSGTGTLNIQSGGAVSADSSFVATDPNSIGTVNLTGPVSSWTVTGGPVIGESGTAFMTISAGGTLTDSGGFIGRSTGGNGTVVVTDPNSLWTNNGTLIVGNSGSGTLTVQNGGHVSNTSYCELGGNAGSSGTLTVTGAGSTFGNGDLYVGFTGKGRLNVLAGGSVTDPNAQVGGAAAPNDGAAIVSGAGSIWTTTNTLNVASSGAGSLQIDNGGTVSAALAYVGSFVGGNGTALVTDVGSSLSNSSFLTIGYLSGTGSLTVQNGATVSSAQASIGNSSGSGSAHITGAGTTWTVPGALGLAFNGTGTLLVDNSATISSSFVSLGFGSGSTATATMNDPNTVWTVGFEIDMSDSSATSTLNLNGGTMTVAGNIVDGGAGVSTLTLDGATLDMQNHNIGSATPIDNLNFRSGTLKNVAQINNGAGLTKTTAGTLTLNTANSYTGTTAVNAGVLRVSNATGSATGLGPVTIANGATLQGSGRISGAIQSSGAVVPGTSAGTLTLLSSYTQNANGSLKAEIGGTTAGSQYDRLAVTGTATLAGTLDVSLINGFVPSVGHTFDVLTAGSVINTFGAVNVPPLPNCKSWQIQYLPTAVRLQVVGCGPLGDLDGDGHVTLADLASLLSVYGTCAGNPAYNPDADLNNDGCVNLSDLAVLLANYGL